MIGFSCIKCRAVFTVGKFAVGVGMAEVHGLAFCPFCGQQQPIPDANAPQAQLQQPERREPVVLDKLFVIVAENVNGDEGLFAVPGPQGPVALVAGDEARLAQHRIMAAQRILAGQPRIHEFLNAVRVYEYASRTERERLM